MSTDCRLYRRSLAIGYYESGSTKEASMIGRVVASLSECEIENVLKGLVWTERSLQGWNWGLCGRYRYSNDGRDRSDERFGGVVG